MTPTGFATKAIRRGSAFPEVCSRNSAYMFFDSTTGSKNYTICKKHVSDMF